MGVSAVQRGVNTEAKRKTRGLEERWMNTRQFVTCVNWWIVQGYQTSLFLRSLSVTNTFCRSSSVCQQAVTSVCDGLGPRQLLLVIKDGYTSQVHASGNASKCEKVDSILETSVYVAVVRGLDVEVQQIFYPSLSSSLLSHRQHGECKECNAVASRESPVGSSVTAMFNPHLKEVGWLENGSLNRCCQRMCTGATEALMDTGSQ